MFQLLFRYPAPVFSKGHFVLLGAWPRWLLVLLIVTFSGALALAIHLRLREAAPKLQGWRAWAIWGMQSTLVALLLLLWQPAIKVAELSSQQNIIAVVVDDSHSMGINDSAGKTREAAAIAALDGGVLSGLRKRFQTRLYRLNGGLRRVETLNDLTAAGSATHVGEGLKQLADETTDLPVGGVVLLSDGAENSAGMGSSGVSLDALNALRNRRLPVQTIGFGSEKHEHDVELEKVSTASSALADARLTATVSFTQRGFAGQKETLTVRDGAKLLAARQISFAADGLLQTEPVFFSAGPAGAKSLRFGVELMPGEENAANNTLTRPALVTDAKRRILYIEGEPRWEFKFIRRAESNDPTVRIVSMLRTSENRVYRQGIGDPGELAEGFPVTPEELFGYAGIIIGSVDAEYFTPSQQELLREYVDRRGGGLLFLGGRSSLSDGGWNASSLRDVLPTFLPSGRSSFHRNPATVELTAAGVDSPITRLLEDPAKNAQRWKKLTYLADYEDPGAPKPGATVLAEMNAGRRKLPLLITENFGHGRTAVLATQNPIELEGTYPLPEAQLDRFLFNSILDYLSADEELKVVDLTTATRAPKIEAVTSAEELLGFQQLVRMVPMAESLARNVVSLVRATRPKTENAPDFIKKYVNYGGSIRAAQFIVLAAKARALSRKRYHVAYEDIAAVAIPVLRHRILLNFQAESERIDTDEILRRLLAQAPRPKEIRES